MKIKMLRNAANSLGCELTEGDTGEVDDALAGQLIDLGIAEPVAPAKKIQGVAKKPAIADSKPVKVADKD